MKSVPLSHWILLIQIGSTFAMIGLIWFVQIVHYPLMSQVGPDQFVDYESDHMRLTTWVVGPLMLAEFGTALALLWSRPEGISSWLVTTGFVVLLIIWLTTYAVQVPQHNTLSGSFDAEIHRNLVVGNWIRTVAWSARGVIVSYMMIQAMKVLEG